MKISCNAKVVSARTANLLEDPEAELKVEGDSRCGRPATLRDQDDPAATRRPLSHSQLGRRHEHTHDKARFPQGLDGCCRRRLLAHESSHLRRLWNRPILRPRSPPSRSSSGTSSSRRRKQPTPTSSATRSPLTFASSRAFRSGRSVSMILAKGLGADVLENCQVLIWWGHVRQAEITSRDRQGDRSEDQGGGPRPDRTPLGPLVDAVRRSHERAGTDRRGEDA